MNDDKKHLIAALNEEETFGPLLKYINQPEVTDVDFDGKNLWTADIDNVKNMVPFWSGEEFENKSKEELDSLTRQFLERFCNKIAMLVQEPFNPGNSVLEAETDTLRITAVHESIATTGRALCIRKTTIKPRYTAEDLITNGYCSKELLALLTNCVHAKMNFVICGEPGVGKTEFGKFLSGYIKPKDRVITIEDNPEWHYGEMYPDRNHIAFKVERENLDTSENIITVDYTKAIKTCMRLNPTWIILSETRSKEAKALIESWSTGVKGITTLHTDTVLKIPDRFMNMIQNTTDAKRIMNDIYDFVDVGILIRRKEQADGREKRYVDQVCFFDRANEQNDIHLIIDEGKFTQTDIPENIQKKLKRAGINETYKYV